MVRDRTVTSAVTHVSQLICAFAAFGIFTTPALAEDLECRWFIAASGRTVPVRCGDAAPPISPFAAQDDRPERELLGLTLAPPTQGLRAKYSIEKSVNGVIVTQVDGRSEAADRGIATGDVILKTNDVDVSTPGDMARSIESATKDGRKAISLLLSNGRGQTSSSRCRLGFEISTGLVRMMLGSLFRTEHSGASVT